MPPDTALLQRELKLYKGLVEVSTLINGITDSKELLTAVLDVARRVLEVEAASIFLVNPEGALELACATGAGTDAAAARARVIVPRGRGISGWVLEHGEPLLVPDAYADPRFYQDADRQTGFRTRSILCVPLKRDGHEIGVLQVLNPAGRAEFDAVDLAAFAAYGNLVATAIEKLRTIDRQRAQDRTAQELEIAREIQRSFLPQTLPQHAHVSFASTYRPALNVGGDFFDVIESGADEIHFVIGDVSGKGMPAALLMAQALSMLRLIVRAGTSPVAAMARWNAMLAGHTIRGMFITAIVGRVTLSTRHVELCSAGHCNPLIGGRADGKVTEVRVPGSPPLGLLPELPGRSHSITLDPSEWLVLFTDGLVESFDAQDREFEVAGASAILAAPFDSAEDVVCALSEGESTHRGSVDPHDDLTLLTFGFR